MPQYLRLAGTRRQAARQLKLASSPSWRAVPSPSSMAKRLCWSQPRPVRLLVKESTLYRLFDYARSGLISRQDPGNFFRPARAARAPRQSLTCPSDGPPLRPLFPKGFAMDVQIIVTVLSADREESDTLASSALRPRS